MLPWGVKMDLTHVDAQGNAQMVDVSGKAATLREATAQGELQLSSEVARLIRDRKAPKGDVFAVARIAGIQAAKETSRWIPLCHPLAIQNVEMEMTLDANTVRITATVKAIDRTGAEMEALCAVSAACLTVYDMCKAVDKGMIIGPIRLCKKTGGKSGTWNHPKL